MVYTPMVTGHKLSSKYKTPKVEKKMYRAMIGGLQYLTHRRPDKANVVDIVVRSQYDPKESHYA